MARLPRVCVSGLPLHVIQRGNNRQVCFGSDEDFAAYVRWLEEYARKFRGAIHAWVFMTNHVHLLVTPETDTGISRLRQAIGRHYVRYFNHTYRRSGTLGEGWLTSCVVDTENYLLPCQRYIEFNPVRAGTVEAQGDYRWSSFRANGLRKPAACWTPHPVYLTLGNTVPERAAAYRQLFRARIEPAMLSDIRKAANQRHGAWRRTVQASG